MKKQILFLFLSLFCITSIAMAGVTGKIAGKIIDAENGEPLPGVNVIIEGTTMGAATDSKGEYFIINIPPGSYTIVATMMGYKTINKTGVLVSVDRTITVDFQLEATVIEGEVVTVVAEREVVQMDVSSSKVTATVAQIKEVPLVQDFNEYVQLQAGIEEELIRGGGLDQVGMLVDGLTMVNNVANEPMNIVNLSAIEEVTIIKGGFQAEYGNIRSGLFNIVTKEGAQDYHASIDFRYTAPHLKHRGYDIFDYRNFYMRPYLDEDVCYVGTRNGPWNAYAQRQYPEFEGWNAFSARLLSDDDPSNDLTPEECRQLFIWQHRADGSKELGHPHPGEYGNNPDHNLDMSFGGPVPFIGKYLGNMSFFASFRNNIEQYILPAARDNVHFQNSHLKLISKISPTMKLGIEGYYTDEINAGEQASNIGEVGRGIYFPHGASGMDIYQSVLGLTFDHVLSPRTFYNLRVSRITVQNKMYGARVLRDTTKIRQIGAVWVDEQPWGWYPISGYQYALADKMVLGGVGGGQRNSNKIATYNVKFDLTSQVNKNNQIKAGFEFNYDDFDVWFGERGLDPTGDFTVDWEHQPIRMGAYVQDKLEFEGMIANVGIRMDWNNPNTLWYTRDPYSKYFSRPYKLLLEAEAPTKDAKGHVTISPRLGISHPITDKSKLFFSYGHFYSMPVSEDMYEINYGVASEGIARIGNPSLKMPRTIAYELGYEHEIAEQFLLSVTGYYKDVTDQIGDVQYINYDETVNYEIAKNDHYADIRGFEIELRKNWGEWITGWVNFTYMVHTNGLIGREVQYQDPRQQAIYGKRNPYQEKPRPQPYGDAMIQMRTPFKWGPKLGNFHPFEQLAVNFLCHYHHGDWFTWDPEPPYKLVDNLHTQDRWNFDARISKDLSFGRFDFTCFVDIVNIFNLKYLSFIWPEEEEGPPFGFQNDADWRDYLKSLHLPMYKEQKYQDAGYTAGDDKVGDVWSEDKPYINMPNLDFLAWNIPRSITLGIQFSF